LITITLRHHLISCIADYAASFLPLSLIIVIMLIAFIAAIDSLMPAGWLA